MWHGHVAIHELVHLFMLLWTKPIIELASAISIVYVRPWRG